MIRDFRVEVFQRSATNLTDHIAFAQCVIMECKKFRLMTSLYLDRQLAQGEAHDYTSHLSICGGCNLYLEETQEVTSWLRNLEQPEVPRELKSYVMTAVEKDNSAKAHPGQRFFEWLLVLNPLPVSYAVGVIISAILFTFTLSGFRPIPVMGSTSSQIAVYPIIRGSDREFHSYNDLPSDNMAATNGADYYELPRVLDNSPLVSFSHLAYQKSGPEGMSALVEIQPDGHAQLVEVLDDPHDPYMVEQLWWSLSKRTFQPAIVKGRAVPTRIILLVEKVDISG